MGKIKRLELTAEQYAELEKGFRNGESHCFRMHCRAVLLNWYSLNCCISRKGFTTTDSITADTVIEFLDTFSFQVRKNTFVVLDNATVHRNHKVKALRPIWEKRGLFLFYLPPYSPHLNIAETLWRILKGKWIRVQDYASTDTLFYAANRILAAVGEDLFIKYSYTVAWFWLLTYWSRKPDI